MGAGAAVIAGLQLFQASGQARGMKAMGNYQKAMSEINARNAQIKAKNTIEQGDESAQEYRKKVNQTVGSQKAAYAGAGVDVGYGSAQQIAQETYEIGAQDALKIKNNAYLAALGYEAEAQEMSRQGRMAQVGANIEASNTLLAGGMRAFGTAYDSYTKENTAKTAKTAKTGG